MVVIAAKQVVALREKTGLGMMECKKALVDANGDIDRAEQLLRIASGQKASKLAGRAASEGRIAIALSPDRKRGAMVEINCETDFVANDATLTFFLDRVAHAALAARTSGLAELKQLPLPSGKTVEEECQFIAAQLGENISVQRACFRDAKGSLAHYLHNFKIGVLVDVLGGNERLGKDVAMHIAAAKPLYLRADELPEADLEKERAIYVAQAAESGKPKEIISKMVEGRIQKYIAEITLLGQAFIKNQDQTIAQLLKEHNASVSAFDCFFVGQGSGNSHSA